VTAAVSRASISRDDGLRADPPSEGGWGPAREKEGDVKIRALLTIAAGLLGSALVMNQALADPLLAGERPATITAIPGVISGDAKWDLVWASSVTADGIVGSPDGGLLFAQEQTNTIKKLDRDGREWVYVKDTHGAGAVSLDKEGRLFAVERTCTDPGLHEPSCPEPTMVGILLPTRKRLADEFSDGSTLGRVNDIIADGKGGAYFTSHGAYYVNSAGTVLTVADKNIFSNGIMLSPDGKTLYVTNNTVVLAFDVHRDGSTGNRRDFASLGKDHGADGMTVDSEGRLYVTAAGGIHVFSPKGKELGVIQTHRYPISLAFSGPDKKTLYAASMGAVGPDGKAFTTPKGVRNTSMTIYKVGMEAQGYMGRPK